VVRPRSFCTACLHQIAWYDNLPVLSYLILGGRCRYCKSRISLRYPVIELSTGLLFFAYFWRLGPSLLAVKCCLYGALMMGLLFADLEQRILPDELTLGGTAAGLLLAWFLPVNEGTVEALLWLAGIHWNPGWMSLGDAALGAGLPALLLWLGGWVYLRLRHREGLGLGDVKLMALVGAFFGLRGALLTLILGSVAGSVLGFAYIKLTHKETATYELPFGTFLGAAAIAVSFAIPVAVGK